MWIAMMVGWLIFALLTYEIGWRVGLGLGTKVTIQELERAGIIFVDRKNDEIKPGKFKKSVPSLSANMADSVINHDQD
jgi:hypothetical protein